MSGPVKGKKKGHEVAQMQSGDGKIKLFRKLCGGRLSAYPITFTKDSRFFFFFFFFLFFILEM
mgnify:CR=1 FL=1